MVIQKALKTGRLDGLFFHTQVTSLFSIGLLSRIPGVISLDATPINMDTMGAAYHLAPPSSTKLETFKNQLNRNAYKQAKHLITWSEWAKVSLIQDYGISEHKITVIPPGVDLAKWKAPDQRPKNTRKVKLLFVGGDFKRKGGNALLQAFRNSICDICELDIVTQSDIDSEGLDSIRVHKDLSANSPELLALYHNADIFVFPTLGDCLPIALMEAMAAGLPIISTGVGAINEMVSDGVNGIIISPDNTESLIEALIRLSNDHEMRNGMGIAGRVIAENKFDATKNYAAVLNLYKSICAEALQ
jgi:glycosyltransferase involved in cell wall biosynthesis